MPDQNVQKIHEWIDQHQDIMVTTLQQILRFPSIQSDAAPGAPFGKANKEALDFTLAFCEKHGFKTKNFEGYAGHADFGEGEEVVMSLGHLDVVPVSEDWKHEPFGAEIDGGYVYARGANDDKGPTYAAMFAAIAIKELGIPLKRKIRLVFGCNEESGFECVKYYFEREPAPKYGFAPDAGWPLIYAEKGIANLVLQSPLKSEGDLKLISADGGQRPNMVPDKAIAKLSGTSESIQKAVSILDERWDKNVTYAVSGNYLELKTTGKACHGSVPWHGDNAVIRLLRALYDLPIENKEWIRFLDEAADQSGTHLGYFGSDDVASLLTNNLGVFEVKDGVISATFNIRYPVKWKGDEITKRCEKNVEKAGFKIAQYDDSPPLYVPLDQEPVKTLLAVYREETGDQTPPATMGGGTYARAVANTVAVGTGFPGDGPAHENDERYALTSYFRAAKIYGHMLYRLANI